MIHTTIQNLSERSRRIDEILDVTDIRIKEQMLPEDFIAGLDVDMIFNEGHAHITISTAKKKGAEWPKHIHEDNSETIVILRGHGIVWIADKSIIVTAGDSLTVPKGILHGGVALEDGTQLASIVIPADPNTAKLLTYLDSIKKGRQ